MRFTEQELATVLYGLRQVQREVTRDPAYVAGSPHFADIDPLNEEEIDELCERINCIPEGMVDAPRPTQPELSPLADVIAQLAAKGGRL